MMLDKSRLDAWLTTEPDETDPVEQAEEMLKIRPADDASEYVWRLYGALGDLVEYCKEIEDEMNALEAGSNPAAAGL
jgi:hypothetical protein